MCIFEFVSAGTLVEDDAWGVVAFLWGDYQYSQLSIALCKAGTNIEVFENTRKDFWFFIRKVKDPLPSRIDIGRSQRSREVRSNAENIMMRCELSPISPNVQSDQGRQKSSACLHQSQIMARAFIQLTFPKERSSQTSSAASTTSQDPSTASWTLRSSPHDRHASRRSA